MSILNKDPADLRKQLKLFALLSVIGLMSFASLVTSVQIQARLEAKALSHGYLAKDYGKQFDRPKYRPSLEPPVYWVPFKQISLQTIQAIIVSEDSRFFSHNGVDPFEIKAAFEDSVFHNKRWRGASTISQQMVKNAFLTHDRNLLRKFREVLFVYEIEDQVSKQKILETYLNVIEYGDQVFGIKDAAETYFGKHPSRLTVREGAFLAMLLPSPKRYSESWKQGQLTQYAHTTVNKILLRLYAAQFISKAQYDRALNETFDWEIKPHVVAH